MNDLTNPSFENTEQPPPEGSRKILPFEWNQIRDTALPPRYASIWSEDIDGRLEFVRGATALGLVGRTKELKPQQLLLADVLNAGCRFTGVLLPRRSTKTTTLLAWLIGRCLSREDYLAAYAVMTSQKKARDRFIKDVVPILERVYPDKETRPFKIVKANGQERLTFDNGAILQFLGPNPDDYRSDAYDVIVLDEGGEAEPEVGEEVLSAALPTQDTRPDAMLVVAGTAAKYRTGNLLWDELESGRLGAERHGILDYSTEDFDITDESLTWEDDILPRVEAAHPGVGNLTTIATIKDNYDRLGREQFGREYLGMFGTIGIGTGFLNFEKWEAMGMDPEHKGGVPDIPDHFRVALAVNVNGDSAALVSAWRDEDGKACLVVEDHRHGTEWVYDRTRTYLKLFKGTLVYDKDVAKVQAEVERLQRVRPKPKFEPQTWAQVATAASLLHSEFERGNIRHWNQIELDEAVKGAKKRHTQDAKKWAFGRVSDMDDITPLEAAALALRAYDDAKPKAKIEIVTSAA